MKFIITILCILISNLLFAEVVEIGLAKKSFSEFYYEKTLKNPPKSSFNKSFLKAVKLYESKEAHKSYRLFKEITDTAYQYDWGDLERKAIAYSFLRLAEQDRNKEDFYVKEALKFASQDEIFLDNFNKNIKQKVLSSSDTNSIPISLYQLVKEPSYVLLNGKQINELHYANLKLPRGKIRLSIISNSAEPLHFIGTRSKLLSGSVGINKLDWGSCLNPKVPHESLRESEFKINFHRQCSLSYKSGAFERHKAPTPKNTKEILYPSIVKDIDFNKSSALRQQSSKAEGKIDSPFRKYLWWGLGILAGAYYIEKNKAPKKVVYK